MLISFIFIQGFLRDNFVDRENQAKWIASIHQKSWDQFISETLTSLQILSLALSTSHEPLEDHEDLLGKVQQMDPRYGSLYLLNNSGTVILGTNSSLISQNLSSKNYIRDSILSKDIVISNETEGYGSYQEVIGIATPVLNENKQLEAILNAYLRIDYVKNVMNVLTPATKLLILNEENDIIINLNVQDPISVKAGKWIEVPIEQVPWTIKVKVADLNVRETILEAAIYVIGIVTIFHILFLLGKYWVLKNKTRREQAENAAQKIELVGTLAASTAHEIRNPLTGIKGLVKLLSEKYTDPEARLYFSVIDDEINRINEIVSEFLILGKPTALESEVLDLREIFNELKPLISSEANLSNVQCSIKVPDASVHVDCIKDQMKQVILNITKNAFESMPIGGSLVIDLINLEDHCIIKISDTGKGIGKRELAKIFEPFYTSKDHGTGLGLVVCKRIIESFSGNIQIESEINKGTTVLITLPKKG